VPDLDFYPGKVFVKRSVGVASLVFAITEVRVHSCLM